MMNLTSESHLTQSFLDWSSSWVSISIFWLNLNTWFQHSDSIWYWLQVDTRFEFSTRLIKKSKMMSNVKIYYFWIYYVIIFERLTWNKWIYFSSRCLHYSVALSDTQINISSTSLHVLMSWIENFKSILDLNLLTRLEYLSWIFWLNSNTQIKNSDSNQVLTNRVLNLNSSIQLDAISLVILHVVDKDSKIMLHDSIDSLNLIIDFRVICHW